MFGHQQQLFATRELGLVRVGFLPCVTVRRSGELLAFVLKYCKSYNGDFCFSFFNERSIQSVISRIHHLLFSTALSQSNSQFNQSGTQREQWGLRCAIPLKSGQGRGPFVRETARFRVQWPVTLPQLATQQGPSDTFLHSKAISVGRTAKRSLRATWWEDEWG